MIDSVIDRVDALAARWRMPLTVITVAWFALTCASYAGFVRLPALELLTSWQGFVLAGVWNAVWWGWLNPRAQRRRAMRGPTKARDNG